MNRLSFFIFLFVCSLAGAQTKADKSVSYRDVDAPGLLPIENYTHQETGGHHQNWVITQDKNGLIYTGNGKGVLEYDGVTWRLISSPGLNAVRAVVVDEKNVKWIGADRDLGYLEPDSLGFLQFTSLKEKIPQSHPLTGNVWQIVVDGDRILFVTESAIYSWRDQRFHVIPRQGEIHRRNQVNGDLYFRVSGKGMYRLDGDTLKLIPNGERFRSIRVDAVLPYRNQSVLFASREEGLFVFDGESVTKFKNEVDDYLIRNNLYSGLLLSDSSYAFATLRRGVIVMDKNGKKIIQITNAEGILNNQVYGLTEDKRNTVWLALQTGISHIEPFLPYKFYDKRSGLEGTVTTITRHKGKLYIGTYDGLFVQEVHAGKFRRVDGIKNGCFSLLSLGNDLLAGSANGIFQISNGRVTEIKSFTACRSLWQWRKDTNRVFVGHRGGLSSIRLENGKWQHEKDIKKVDGEIRSIVEDDGGLWLGTTLHNIIKVDFIAADSGDRRTYLDKVIIKDYDDRDGLPKETNSVFLIDGDLLVYVYGGDGSLFRFDNDTGKFSKATAYGRKFGIDTLSIYPIGYQLDGGYILLGSIPKDGKSYRFSAARQPGSTTYTLKRIYDDRFRSTTENSVYWEGENLVWFGGENITRYDLNTTIDPRPRFKTYIRKVTLGQGATIYGGDTSALIKPALEYTNNELRFEFAAPGFMGKQTNRYQFQLIGFDDRWSNWTAETRKDYTNLPEGDYQFAVRSQNIYGELSDADVFNFEILAPWYRTWWAYALYAILFLGFLFFALQLRARKLKSEKRALGLVVAARTEEIRSQANQLKIQAEKLQELDRAKSRFFANISHEFRTPLTLISGCLEDLTKNTDGEETQARISIMQKNAMRLRQLIEQLLDLSKLENGKHSLNVAPINPGNFLRAITSSFSSWATQKEITLSVDLPDPAVTAYLDEDVIEKIINNLLSNAIKFTPRLGRVSLSGRWNEDELTVIVKDNGPGIPKSKISQIFERFYQVDDSNTRTQEGSGIGLALVKELVELHHGELTVESEVSAGTSFNVTIPIHEKNYSSSEIGLGQKSKVALVPAQVSNDKPGETYSEFTEGSPDSPIILVVEDNIDLGQYIGDHLPDCGIVLAVNGKDGFNKAVQHIPDLIVSDVMMPEMDGVELCHNLKNDERTSHIPVILLTAKADLESRLEGLETGADDYITKPFDSRELQTRVKNLIIQRTKLRERFSRTMILKPKDIAITPPDESFLKKVMGIVENHLSDSEFSVDEFQKEIGMSRMQLHRKLKALTGHSAGEFVRIQRLVRASEMLSKTDNNISEVCYQTGFTSLSYFAKCFKKQFGATPKEYSDMRSQIRHRYN